MLGQENPGSLPVLKVHMPRALLHLALNCPQSSRVPFKRKGFPPPLLPPRPGSVSRSASYCSLWPSVRAGFPLINHRNRYRVTDRQTDRYPVRAAPGLVRGCSDRGFIPNDSVLNTAQHAVCRRTYSLCSALV